MARPMYKKLTKEMLQDWGITDINYDYTNNEWKVMRYWYKNNSKVKQFKQLAICNAVCKHKYTTDKSYPIITFSYKQQMISLPLSRLIYVWYNGDINDGFVVDHIDNNPYNNNPKNLQLLTQEQNLIKRFVDNPSNFKNQWAKINKIKYEIVHKAYLEGKTYEEAQEELYKICGEN